MTAARPHAHRLPALRAELVEDRKPQRTRWPVLAVVFATTGAATAVGSIYVRPTAAEWGTLALVFFLVALLETRGGIASQVGRATMTFSAKAYASIGAVYLLGLPGAAASSLATLLSGIVYRRGLSIKVVFNSAMSLLVYSSAYWVYSTIRGTATFQGGSNSDVVWLMVAGAIGGLAAWLANQGLLGMVLVADQGSGTSAAGSSPRRWAASCPTTSATA